MDGSDFDRLTTAVSVATTRRAALLALLSGLLTPLFPSAVAAREQRGQPDPHDRRREPRHQVSAEKKGKKKKKCKGGKKKCGKKCLDLQTDVANCGGCGHTCEPGRSCQGGVCTLGCANGQTECGDRCADLLTDANHCGLCDNACSGDTPVCNGSGECACGDVCASGCRYATVQAALNAFRPDPDFDIHICAGTYATSSVPIVNKPTLIGAGSGESGTILDGGDAFRLFRVENHASLTLRNLRINQGSNGDGEGILNHGELTLVDTIVTGGKGQGINTSSSHPGTVTLIDSQVTGLSSGIWNGGGCTLTLTNGHVTDNSSWGIISNGTLTLEGSTVRGNGFPDSSVGGGIHNHGMATLKAGSVVTGNKSSTGGGILNGSPGTLTLEAGSAVTDNEASRFGGGVWVGDGSTVTLQAGSSVTGNRAGIGGGGIANNAGTVNGDVNAIVTGNTPDNYCDYDSETGTCS